MFRKTRCSYTLIALLLMLSLSVPVLSSCGGDDNGETPTSTPTLTPTSSLASTFTAETIPSNEPVYIGAICAWSGAAAMSGLLATEAIEVVEQQVRESGGILGGREVKFLKEDNKSEVAQTVAVDKKLILDERVAALVFGGINPSEIMATTDVAEENQILFVSFSGGEWLYPKKFSISATIDEALTVQSRVDLTSRLLKPETVAFLAANNEGSRRLVEWMSQDLEELGIETISKQYVDQGIFDMSPYLTNVKYENPDVLILDANASDFHLAVAKQITGLGGWGDIKVVTLPSGEQARTMPGAEGWYIMVPWLPEMQNPGSIKFVDDFQRIHGKDPLPIHLYFYQTLWTAIEAIKLAGTDTDRVAIAEAARSGNLEWETPLGLARWNTDGYTEIELHFALVGEGGKLSLIDIP